MSGYFQILSDYLAKCSGISLGQDKEYLFEMRLKSLMRDIGCTSLPALADMVVSDYANDAAFQSAFIDAMTTNESMFFRDGHPFEMLRHHIMPMLAEKSNVAMWSCACAAGQEAYSLAMLAEEAGLQDYYLLATDIDSTMVARATSGIYNQFEIQRGLKTEQMLRYFSPLDAHHWKVDDRLKRNVHVMQDNLLQPRISRMYDVILCRYVLIYFDEATKIRIITMLREMLNVGGVLLLGSAETMPHSITGLEPYGKDRSLYIKC
jgi:chemotaxis protein methyltransferase CheR